MGRQEFADKTGIAKGTLIRTEQGQNSPQVAVLLKIAELWPEYSAFLLTDETDVKQQNPEKEALVGRILRKRFAPRPPGWMSTRQPVGTFLMAILY